MIMSAASIPFVILGFNALILVVVGLLAFIGKGTHKRIDSVKEALDDYQTKEICDIHREAMEKDINNLGDKVRGDK